MYNDISQYVNMRVAEMVGYIENLEELPGRLVYWTLYIGFGDFVGRMYTYLYTWVDIDDISESQFNELLKMARELVQQANEELKPYVVRHGPIIILLRGDRYLKFEALIPHGLEQDDENTLRSVFKKYSLKFLNSTLHYYNEHVLPKVIAKKLKC